MKRLRRKPGDASHQPCSLHNGVQTAWQRRLWNWQRGRSAGVSALRRHILKVNLGKGYFLSANGRSVLER